MTGTAILTGKVRKTKGTAHGKHPNLHTLWSKPHLLPRRMRGDTSTRRILDLLGPLHWTGFPERDLERRYRFQTLPYAAYAAAFLVQLNEGLFHTPRLRRYLSEHQNLISLLGFTSLTRRPNGDRENSLPTARHFTRMLREMPNDALQYLLEDSLRLILAELGEKGVKDVGQTISLDTKHIIAWVKENNRKAYVETRYDRTQQPAGDPDCKLGCKRRHNQISTPREDGVPAKHLTVGEYYWGYGSGVVATKVPGYGEFVIAELTQPLNRADMTYFFPLMAQTEQRLGFRPRWGAFDAAFDAFYVYEYFHQADDPGAFAAVPYVRKGRYAQGERQFSADGSPLCKAGLPMGVQQRYMDRTKALIVHERARYGCPLKGHESRGCPIEHSQWRKKGCTVNLPTSVGTRLRHELDRNSAAYKRIYDQRTATERINAQAVALGIERPKLRNGQAITNRNTLIYVLINLRMLSRLRHRE